MLNNISDQFYNCVVYCIINKNKKLIYYGSTTQLLNHRITHHKKPSNKTSSKILFENEKDENIEVKVLHRGNFNSINDLRIREKLYIKNHSASTRNCYNCVNQCVPARSRREYYLDNKTYIINKNTEWAKNNRQKVNESARKRYPEYKKKVLSKINCECGSQVCRAVFSRHKKTIKHIKFLENKEE